MPMSAPKPCAHPSCGVLVRDGSSRCALHQVLPGRYADRSRGSSTERGYGAAWRRARERVLSRDGGLCQPCLRGGFTKTATEVDHIVNKAEGGTDDDNNLQAICEPCHKAKTAQEAARARSGRGSAPG